MKRIRVVVADDHTIVRQGLLALLNEQQDIEVVAEAEDGRDALKKVEKFLPDILILDVGMPRLNGLEAARQIKRQNQTVKILMLTMHSDEEYIFETLKAGASGYLLKDAAATELITAIHSIHSGQSYLSPSVSHRVIENYIRRSDPPNNEDTGSHKLLTEREREVLQLVAEGKTNREIADILNISIKTVDNHRTNLMNKLDIHDRAGIVRYAIRKGIITLTD
jgi:two-component system response regulator NreC